MNRKNIGIGDDVCVTLIRNTKQLLFGVSKSIKFFSVNSATIVKLKWISRAQNTCSYRSYFLSLSHRLPWWIFKFSVCYSSTDSTALAFQMFQKREREKSREFLKKFLFFMLKSSWFEKEKKMKNCFKNSNDVILLKLCNMNK